MDKKGFLEFMKLLKTDLCLTLFMIGFMLHNVTVTQLMEDKMCLSQLGLDKEFCSKLTELHSNETSTKAILKNANVFKNGQFIILNIPALILSIFLGYWLGNYPKYIKFMIILPLASSVCMMLLLLINAFAFNIPWQILLLSYLPVALGGGTFLIFASCYTYISWSTPNELLIVRFAVLEFLVQAGTLMATYAGGKILSMEPWIKGQNKNYIGVFLVALVSLVSGLIYACLMTLEFTPSTEPDKDKLSFFQVLKDVFQIGRFKQLVKLFTKQRPNNGRLRLILLITSGAVCLAAILGEDGIAYQFAQKVYGLTQDQYTSLYSILCIAPAIVTSIGPPIGRSYFGFSDSIIAILGCISLIAFYLIRGLILSVRGYIAGFLIGAFCRIATAAIRSLVSGMVDSAESAQVFTLATAFENYISLGATLFYTSVFSATIGHHPGLVLILIACCLIYPLTIVCWVEYTRSEWQTKSNDEVVSTPRSSIANVILTLDNLKTNDPISS
ncbi:uncharacterized protein LOC107366307 [Tetranychus urticae]|uniref:Major facilitator superfamily (MFS) profile domain-containing protein n=1 Tax=Tetranychus urticae TaxID=32264 RepID=T1KQB9_TETUR|nr:uncharacterized protein LOC107366307 [Tetranychus urticae]